MSHMMNTTDLREPAGMMVRPQKNQQYNPLFGSKLIYTRSKWLFSISQSFFMVTHSVCSFSGRILSEAAGDRVIIC